jgi:thiol-disulfide isomerase/thioredoxin
MKGKYALFVILVVLAVVGLGVFAGKHPSAPSKYADLAQTLKNDGVQFFGAFWCPHCQKVEEDFKMTRKQLADIGLYQECSNPDQSPTAICTENKIESFPTFKYGKGLTITSDAAPIICDALPVKPGATGPCANEQMLSKYLKSYFFPQYGFTIRSEKDPVKSGTNIWKFESGSETVGEVPLDFLASQVGYTLPQ